MCLVGTHESMFSCMNMSVFYWYVCVFVGLVQMSLCLVLKICLCSVVSSTKKYEGTCVYLWCWYIRVDD